MRATKERARPRRTRPFRGAALLCVRVLGAASVAVLGQAVPAAPGLAAAAAPAAPPARLTASAAVRERLAAGEKLLAQKEWQAAIEAFREADRLAGGSCAECEADLARVLNEVAS